MHYSIISLILLISQSLFAMSYFFPEEKPNIRVPVYTPPVRKPEPMACLTRAQMIQKSIFYCPKASELVRDGLKWTGPEPWKAYSESFVTKIDRFTGAQWSGPTGSLGRLVCFYTGVQKDTFPVKITTTVLIKKPVLPLWEQASKTDDFNTTLMNCVTTRNNVCDCPFSISSSVSTDNKSEQENVQSLKESI